MKQQLHHYHLLLVLLPFPNDDCVKRFHEQKEQSRTQPPILGVLFVLNHEVNANPSMDKKHNPGKDPAKKREKHHDDVKP